MSPSDLTILVPVAFLLALQFVRPGRSGSVWVIPLIALSLVAAFLVARACVPDEFLWPGSEVARRTRWLERHLKKRKGWENHPVILLTGSSATYYGVDPLELEKKLSDSGTPATVLSFCMPGDNHHERLYMLEAFLNRIGPRHREALKAARVYHFGEVFNDYDWNPLNRMDKEAYSERAIMFLSPACSWQAWESYARLLEQDPALPRWGAAFQLAHHALLNRFGVGAFAEWNWERNFRRKTPPFFPLEGRKADFDFSDQAGKVSSWLSKQSLKKMPMELFPQWQVILRHLHQQMDDYVDVYGAYCLPTLEPHRLRYEKWFASRAPEGFIVLGPPTPLEMAIFLREDLWFDGVHPTGSGAGEVTGWLAAQLHRTLSEDE